MRSGEALRRLTASAEAPARAGWPRRSQLDGQTIATAAPRSALSRSSVSLAPTAAASQGRSVGDLAISDTISSSSFLGISAILALGRGGGSFRWQCISTTGVFPSNGGLPTSIWYKHDPEGIEVGLVADGRGAANLLGRHVSRRSQRSARRRQRGRVQVLGDPEIGQLDLAVGRDHQVRRLQIAVDDAMLVGVVQRVADLDSQLDHLAPGQVPAILEHFLQGLALDVLHGDVRGAAELAPRQEPDDVGMAELLEDLGFAFEPVADLALLAQTRCSMTLTAAGFPFFSFVPR